MAANKCPGSMQRRIFDPATLENNAFYGRTAVCPHCNKRVQVRVQRDNLVTHTAPRSL